MTLAELLRQIVGVLDRHAIPYMLTGSVAAAVHGFERTTRDLDIVIDPAMHAVDALCADLEARGLYVSAEAAREAVTTHAMFNVIDGESGWKVDFIVRKDRPVSRSEFDRRIMVRLADQEVSVATVEDVILAKLEWARLGASVRQIDDVRALLDVTGDDLDRGYVERWVSALGLGAQWGAAIAP